MAGQIQLKLGDMFYGTSDLIVLPCSTNGAITQFVYNKLKTHNIPDPGTDWELGQVKTMPFTGSENIAQYVAFAASVQNNHSEISAIEQIAMQIGKLTQQNPAIQIINIPLLGAGAGRLDEIDVVEALKRGFQKYSSNESVLIIHVLYQDSFNRITDHFKGNKAEKSPLPELDITENKKSLRVFISWTKTNDEHWAWTEQLGKFLRDNGVNARMDMWHLKSGMDLPQFMTNELSLADKVLIISNEAYTEKADGRMGGVGWETMIIQGDMSRQAPDSTKYLVVVTSEDIEKGLPVYLKSKYVIHWKGKDREKINRQQLLSELLNIVEEPPLGVAPVYL